jgi:hypothetical protein
MIAGFEGNVEIGIPRAFPGIGQGIHFGVGGPHPPMVTLPHDFALTHHDGANHGIGTHPSHSSGSQPQGFLHESSIKVGHI